MQFTISKPNLHFSRTRTRRTRTDAIVVHHLDAHWDVHRTHEFHNSLGWNGIGYNFHVAMNGTISLGRGMEFQGAHTNPPAGINETTIGIGCEGRFHSMDRTMPDVQFNALVWLIRHLRGIYGNLPIGGHRDLAATACPGQFFPMAELQRLAFRGVQNEIQQDETMETEERFQRIEEMPTWARGYIERLTQETDPDGNPILRGDGRGNFDLSLDMLRLLVIIERRLGALER